jgi:fructokinase
MVLVIGEALVDIVVRPDGSRAEHPGGSPANVAVGLGRLGVTPVLATSLATDDLGALVRMHLAESGVRLMPGLKELERTSTAVATLAEDGSATYDFDLCWDPGRIWAEEVPDIVHTGSIAAFLEPGADEVEDALRRLAPMCTVTFDPNVRPSLLPSRAEALDRVQTLLPLCDVVKVSDEDLAWLEPHSDPADTARSWLAAGPAAVVMTMGPRGARTYTHRGSIGSPAMASHVVDTVGAGDAFMSGLIAGLKDDGVDGLVGSTRLHAADVGLWRHVTDLASRCSAFVVGRAGAQPPWEHEL